MEKPTTNSRNQDCFHLPVGADILFSNHKNIYKRAVEKHQQKLLKKISFIKPFLDEGEKIVQITTGCSPVSLIEQLLTGWFVFYLKRSLFVFTDKRIFHIPTKPNFSYRYSIAQILYADCRSITIKGRTLVAEYKNGKTEKFIYIAGREKKKIKTLLKDMSLQGRPSQALQRIHLCPRCTSPLVEGRYTCSNCSLEFKNRKDAKRISIIYPGGGYFYAGHPFLGLADALVEVYLSLLVLIALIDAIMGVAGSALAFVLLGVLLATEKALTVYHSNHFIKEFIPKERTVQVYTEQPTPVEQSESAEEPQAEQILSVR